MQVSFDTNNAADVRAAVVLMTALGLIPTNTSGGSGGSGGSGSGGSSVPLPNVLGTVPPGASWKSSGVPGGAMVLTNADGTPVPGNWEVVSNKSVFVIS